MFTKYDKENPIFFWIPLCSFACVMVLFVKEVPYPSQDLLIAWYIAIIKVVSICYFMFLFLIKFFYKIMDNICNKMCNRYGKLKGLILFVLFSLFLVGGMIICLLILK